jgi:hypothetical protein
LLIYFSQIPNQNLKFIFKNLLNKIIFEEHKLFLRTNLRFSKTKFSLRTSLLKGWLASLKGSQTTAKNKNKEAKS